VDVRNVLGVSIGQAIKLSIDHPESAELAAHLAELHRAVSAFDDFLDAVEAHNEASDEYAASYGSDAERALREKIVARERLDAALARVQPTT
jgi:hypothetical protein